MYSLFLLLAAALAIQMPVYTDIDCTSSVNYTVEYTLGDCYKIYTCGSANCANIPTCSGLPLNAFYECMGCAANGQSAFINETTYRQFSTLTCSGFAIGLDVTDSCWVDPISICSGSRIRLLNENGTFPSVTSTTSIGGDGGDGDGDGDGGSGARSSSASVLSQFLF